MLHSIALTGGIASGKSTVCAEFASLGVDIICSDKAARSVVEVGTPALTEIVEHFGASVLHTDGTLNRKALRGLIFDHAAEKQWLEQLLHPLIRQALYQQALNSKTAYHILDIPLLTPASRSHYAYIQKVIVVEVPPSIQLQRLCERDHLDAASAQKIIAQQITAEQRRQLADFVINNDGSLEMLQKQVRNVHQQVLSLFDQK